MPSHNLLPNLINKASHVFPVLSNILHSGIRFKNFMILEILLRIGLLKDQKLINGRWGRGEQYVRKIYFYRNISEHLFETSFPI